LVVDEDNNEIHSFEDLEGKNVGSQKGTIYHDLLEESGLAEAITVYEAIGEMLQELSNGRDDDVSRDEAVAKYLDAIHRKLKVIKHIKYNTKKIIIILKLKLLMTMNLKLWMVYD